MGVFTTCIFYKHSQQQDFLLAFIDTPKQIAVFTAQRCHFQSSRGVILLRLTCFAPSAIHEKKNTVRLPGEKNYLFYPARTGINFPHFQLAGRSFRFYFPASSNSARREDILSSGYVGYSF